MKRLYAVILVCVSFTFCLFASCISREAAERNNPKPVYHTVTFYQGGTVVTQSSVEGGQTLADYPRDQVWRDERGQIAELEGLVVTEDRSFYVLEPVTLRTTHVRYLTGENSLFRPDEALTRGQAAQIAASLMENATDVLGGVSFTDVTSDSDYYNAVQAVSSMAVMTGYADGTFRPNEPITRGEMVTVLCRLKNVDAVQALAFDDVTADHWSLGSVAAAMTEGWINGYEDGDFYPDSPITRAETVVLVNRALGRTPNKTAIDIVYERSPYQDVSRRHWAYYDIVDVSVSGELLSYILGEVEGVQPGFVVIGEDLCHVNEELTLDLFEKGFHRIEDGLATDGLYYVEEDGYFIQRNQPGLKEFDGSMFYVENADGPYVSNYDLGYLHFGDNGRYTTGDLELDGLVNNAMQPIIQGRTENLLNEAKLREAFDYVARYGGFDYMRRQDGGWPRGSTNWTITAGKIMLAEKKGTCYYWAAAFLHLARRLGYQAYPIAGGVFDTNGLHAWVMIDGDDGTEYIYDTELDWAFRTGAHGRTYRRYGMDMFKWPRGKKGVTYVFPGDTYIAPPMDDFDLLGEDMAADIVWPLEFGGSAYIMVDDEMVVLETVWEPIYDEAGEITGYTITAVYEGTTYTYEMLLEEMTEPTPTPPMEGEPTPTPPMEGGATPTPPMEGGATPTPPQGGEATPTPPQGGEATPTPPMEGEPTPTPPQESEATPTPPTENEPTQPPPTEAVPTNPPPAEPTPGNTETGGDAEVTALIPVSAQGKR